jgi:signal transduction histidine kinase
MEIPFYNSLRFKLSVGYFILVGISIFITIWAIINFNRLGSSVDKIIRENYLSVVAAENMARSLEVEDNALTALITYQTKKDLDIYNQTKLEFFQWHQKALDRVVKEQQRALLDSIRLQHRIYSELGDTLLMFIFDPQLNQIAKTYHFNEIRPVNQNLKQYCFRLIDFNQQEMFELDKRARQISSKASYAVLIASLIAVALSIIASVQFTRSFVEPAERLTETVRKIGLGRLDLKTDIISNDEFGELSREFNKMTERLRKFEALNIEKLLEEKQKSETIVHNISDAIVVSDKNNKVILINDAARRLFKIKTPNVEGFDIRSIIKDERVIDILLNPRTEKYLQQPFLLFQADNQPVYIRPRISEIPLTGNETLGTVLILQDVTQFKQLDRMKSEFMATVSHEFRTPLTSINMSIDLLNQGILGSMNKDQQDLLQSAKQDADRLTKLVRELLELSKLESGKLQLRNEPVSLNQVITDTVKHIQLPFKEKSVELKLKLAGDLPNVNADSQQLGWVVSNLVTNALRYTPKGGTVEVITSKEDSYIIVKVKDSGRGIPGEFLNQIFDKFTQVKQVSESTPGSVGLGLAIAKEVVEMYGGRIWAESEIDEGSTFIFTIPIETKI